MQNMKVDRLMRTIIGNLMPVMGKDANPELWAVYNDLQKWIFLVEHKTPLASENALRQTVKDIQGRLNNLSDRPLADAIEQTIGNVTSH